MKKETLLFKVLGICDNHYILHLYQGNSYLSSAFAEITGECTSFSPQDSSDARFSEAGEYTV